MRPPKTFFAETLWYKFGGVFATAINCLEHVSLVLYSVCDSLMALCVADSRGPASTTRMATYDIHILQLYSGPLLLCVEIPQRKIRLRTHSSLTLSCI